jgi:hypothetical protein
MTIEWNKVTPYSKIAAVVLFVGTFFIGLWLGRMETNIVYVEVPHITRSQDSEKTYVIEDATSERLGEQEVTEQAVVTMANIENPQKQSVISSPISVPTLPTSPSALPPKPKATPSPVELTTYTHSSFGFSFNYPKTWVTIPNYPNDSSSISFSRYPQNSESLEMHMTVGEKLNMEQVVSSNAVDYKKETIVVAGTSVQKLTFEQYDRHGGSLGFMREIHIAVPLPSGKFLNLLGVCSTVGSSYDGRCTTTIDDIMNTIVIPSIKM